MRFKIWIATKITFQTKNDQFFVQYQFSFMLNKIKTIKIVLKLII